jgi:hypothetical protein
LFYISLGNQIRWFTSSFVYTGDFLTTGTLDLISISYSDTPGLSRFYSGVTALTKFYLTSGGSPIGGDPHVSPIIGLPYLLPNIEECFNLFDNKEENDRVIVNTKCWFLSQHVINKYPVKLRNKKIFKTMTFMRFIQIIFRGEFMIIDLEGLIIIDNKIINGIIISDIYENIDGLYNINTKKYRKKGATYERIITINSKTKITLSFAPENTDRNNIFINFDSNKEINEYNYNGALIYNSDWKIDSFI